MIAAVTAPLTSLIVLAMSLVSIVATPPATPATECTLDPVTLPLFDATPAEVILESPHAQAIVPELDEHGATEAVELLLACAGAETQDLRYAIFTDRYLANLFIGPEPADQPAFERMIEAGAVAEPATAELLGVSEFEVLEDGRVAVTIDAETASGPIHDRVVLAWDNAQGAWLIDEVLQLDPPVATPAA